MSDLATLTELEAEIDNLERSKPSAGATSKKQLEYYKKLSALLAERMKIFDEDYSEMRESRARERIKVRQGDTTSENLKNILKESEAIIRRAAKEIKSRAELSSPGRRR